MDIKAKAKRLGDFIGCEGIAWREDAIMKAMSECAAEALEQQAEAITFGPAGMKPLDIVDGCRSQAAALRSHPAPEKP